MLQVVDWVICETTAANVFACLGVHWPLAVVLPGLMAVVVARGLQFFVFLSPGACC